MWILSHLNQNVAKEYVLELLNYNNKPDLFEQLQMWTPPRFPINGGVLHANGVAKGRMVGVVMNELKDSWADGNFEKTQEDLLKELPAILSKLKGAESGNVTKKQKVK